MRKTGKNLSKIGIMMVLCFLIPVFFFDKDGKCLNYNK